MSRAQTLATAATLLLAVLAAAAAHAPVARALLTNKQISHAFLANLQFAKEEAAPGGGGGGSAAARRAARVTHLAELERGVLRCADFVDGRVRFLSRWPFGIGTQKEAYLGEYDGGLLVIKMPRRNVFSLGAKHALDANATHTLFDDKYGGGLTRHGDHFSPAVVAETRRFDELFAPPADERWSALSAPYFGGCADAVYGPLRAVAQKGPVLNLDKLVLAYHFKLGWAARLRVVVQAFRLLVELAASDRLFTDLQVHQFGVDETLSLRVYDLGLTTHRYGDAPLESDRACRTDADCTPRMHLPGSLRWLGYDQRCEVARDGGRCAGFDARTFVALMVHLTLRPLLIAHRYETPDALFEPRVLDIDWHCSEPDRHKRWDHTQCYDALLALYDDYDGHAAYEHQIGSLRGIFTRFVLSMVHSAELHNRAMSKSGHSMPTAAATRHADRDQLGGLAPTAYYAARAAEWFDAQPDAAAALKRERKQAV